MARALWTLWLLYLFNLAAVRASPHFEAGKDDQVLIADFPPPVERPGGADVWTVGDVETVKWSTKGLNFTLDQTGTILLGYLTTDGSQTLFVDQPLAGNFTLASGAVNVVVPKVPSGNAYFIIVLGDANNWGPLFSIINPNEPSSSVAPTSLAWISGSAAPSITAVVKA
ncbi:hypothetical protein DICSQDRAFT_140660 [Dichomitus squalens LYAD-421 SS1]|uniref:Ser-Thr-rich glycosyl-phosphatidyl-inositol-anchored membrane family-domain-containing protein n=1 Tax=Dichomitus squalens (strain LYAD-421) TaxID=732165 RepID=R7SLT7_DICSQ|nr:uncharacterized protein DICSQDRAFT_140660 [Dichomitus squalens LYAD-421 SS1]EJF57109.1 hypothetical protein DICSQDRAFT_140660 [Dichomitus squalens LYAD-421 SS1]